MIRGRSKRDWPRMIVRRSRPVIGEQRKRTIVRRGVGVVPAADAPRGREPVIGGRNWWIPKSQIIILSVLAALIIVVAGGGVWALRSPFFKVSKITVTGANGEVTQSDVVEKASLYDASMFTADLAAAQKNIAAMPLVASVKIAREWPHSIAIVVTEREPWGTWEQSGVDYIIDRQGVVLGPGKTAAGTPIIKSADAGNHQLGDHVDYQAVDAAAAIYAQLPKALGTAVADVSFVAGTGVQVTTASGQTALFGDSSSIAYKLAVWAAVQQKAQSEHIQYTTVDLRFGNRPVVR